MSARQLTGNDDVAVLNQDLNRHTAVFVVLQAIRHNRIRDLIADLAEETTDITILPEPVDAAALVSLYETYRNSVPLSSADEKISFKTSIYKKNKK